ncbi:hypothetical protein JW848_03410 [Candidatus Bipolaricaulota bacterium]|nr:hypothetical protein [Candidatus Bipolaricaulota bacterium]
MTAVRPQPSDRVRVSRRRCGGRVAVALAIVGLSLSLWGTPSTSQQQAWSEREFSPQITPPGVSYLSVSTTSHDIHFSFSRGIVDRFEARLDVDTTAGVELATRVEIVDRIPLKVVVQATWRGPPEFAASWQLGPLGIDLTRELEPAGTMRASAAWAVSDRLLVGVGWTGRRPFAERTEHSWLVWVQLLALRQWAGWRLWIGLGGGGISCYRAWVG